MPQRSSRLTRRAVDAQPILWLLDNAVFLHVQEEGRLLFFLARRVFEKSERTELGERTADIKAHRPAA